MPSDGHLVGQLLLKLAEEGNKPGPGLEAKFRNRILGRFQNADWAPIACSDNYKRSLPHRLGKSSVNLFRENGARAFIPLRPVVKGDLILPYLSVVANETLAVFRLLLLAFVEEAENGRLRSVGLRFESPEGKGGRHDFWHVQLTSSFEQNGGQVHPSTPSWLPSNAPAVPLDASSAASCVVALAVALYGSVEADTLVRNLMPGISPEAVGNLRREVRALSENRGG